jgi:hypothetical protein
LFFKEKSLYEHNNPNEISNSGITKKKDETIVFNDKNKQKMHRESEYKSNFTNKFIWEKKMTKDIHEQVNQYSEEP